MSNTILTLFGEEIVPEKKAAKPKAAPKPNAEKKKVVQKKSLEVDTEVLKDWEGKKQYYAIGEVAKLFNVRTSNIRFWTKEFEMKVRTTRKGDRLYTPNQIREIRTIYYLVKEKGYTINGAKAQLKNNKKANMESADLRESLKDLRKKLVQIKKRL